VVRQITATATTKSAAERALLQKLVNRATPTHAIVTADTTLAKLADLWVSYLREEGRIEASPINEYPACPDPRRPPRPRGPAAA
jgi:hypothetical protein